MDDERLPDPQLRPFTLERAADGQAILRAFSDDSDDPIVVLLDEHAARELGVALADAITALDDPSRPLVRRSLVAGGRTIRVETSGEAVRVTVARGPSE